MIILTEADKAVLGWLEGWGSSMVSIRRISRDTHLPRVTVRTSLAALACNDVICQAVTMNDPGRDSRHILHIHPERVDDPAGGCPRDLSCSHGT